MLVLINMQELVETITKPELEEAIFNEKDESLTNGAKKIAV